MNKSHEQRMEELNDIEEKIGAIMNDNSITIDKRIDEANKLLKPVCQDLFGKPNRKAIKGPIKKG